MLHRFPALIVVFFLLLSGSVAAQIAPDFVWKLLPDKQMDEIIGEASGETAYHTIMETGGYNKDRKKEEYAGLFYETKYILEQLKLYQLEEVDLKRIPGREVWDGIKGELWEIKPDRRKLASYQDMTAMLVKGSSDGDVKAPLVWVGDGGKDKINEDQVSGKIAVTEGSVSSVLRRVLEKGGLGVVAISQSKDPFSIPWSGIWTRGKAEGFAFYLPAREGAFLKKRLLYGEKIEVHAQVETSMEKYDLQDISCCIPGSDPDGDEVIFSAHLFEGITKQGANDNKSGSAAILEVARVLHTLIKEKRLPQPKRTIRFLWGPEFSGTGPWVREHRELMKRTLCNINMDMVGEWLSKHQAHLCLIRTSYGQAHYINDVMENYFRFVGYGSRKRLHTRRSVYNVPFRIVAPTGADEPFLYCIETHSGSSDHEVFNDWGVQVPGVMMIAWPDPWLHTSEDRVNKSDPTQLKRVAVIGAAAAYTIASADTHMAIKIAGEVAGNGARRLGHQLTAALEDLNNADAASLEEAYKMACSRITSAMDCEKATVQSVLELAPEDQDLVQYTDKIKETIKRSGEDHLTLVHSHMKAVAKKLNRAPVVIELSDLEKKAITLVPRQTGKVTENGYGGYRDLISKVSRDKYPYSRRDIADSSELRALINGERNALQIKQALDAQNSRKSKLESVMNYLMVLKEAGLIQM